MQIKKFIKEIPDFPLHSNGLIDVPKDLADIVESAIGAVFMDSNSLDTVWKVLIRHILTVTIEAFINHNIEKIKTAFLFWSDAGV